MVNGAAAMEGLMTCNSSIHIGEFWFLADLRPERADLRSEKAHLSSERTDLWPE